MGHSWYHYSCLEGGTDVKTRRQEKLVPRGLQRRRINRSPRSTPIASIRSGAANMRPVTKTSARIIRETSAKRRIAIKVLANR